jgi:hypothetical protein
VTIKRRTPLPRQSPKRAREQGRTFSTIVGPRQRPKRRNAKRKPSEFARCFGSKARVQFVKSLPCCVTGRRGGIDNAHVIRDGSEGMGRRGGFACIAPLRHELHSLLHTSPARFTERYGTPDFAKAAAETEQRWRVECGEGE